MNCSTPGLLVHHQLPEFTETHVHQVGDAIHPSHPLLSPSPPAPQSLPASESFTMSQLFAWGGQSTGVSFLPKNTQDWSPLGWTGWIFLQSKGLSRVFSNTTVQKHKFFGSQLSSQSNSHIHTWPLFTVHVLLKPGLENFEHYFTSVWDECNCAVVWAFFGIAFLWDWNENWPFPVVWPLLSFPNLKIRLLIHKLLSAKYVSSLQVVLIIKNLLTCHMYS